MANQSKRISELPSLSPASLDTTFVVGISGSTTYKISVNQLTSSLDTTFATDLVTNTLSSSLNTKLSTSSFNSYTASISTGSLVTSISNLNTFTASVTTASIVTSISNLNTFTASISTASLVTSISNLNTFTASQSTSSLVSRLNAIENVSGSWITESETGSFLTSLSGAISSSSQLTSSYDTRYTLSGSVQPLPSNLLSSSAQITAFGFISSSAAIPAGTISGSAQITSFGFVSGSYETTGRGIISSSANLVTTSSFNSYTASISTASLVTSISNLNTFTASVSTASLVTSITNLNTFTSSYNTWTSSLSAIGTLNVDYINAGRITSDQTGAGSGNDIIFNYANVSSGISLNTSTGVFTLTANKTYKLFAELSFSNFSDTANGYIIYDWVDATTNTRLATTGIGAGVGENINRNTNEFNATSTTLIYTPTTNQTIKVRIVEAVGTVTVRAGIGTKATIEQINPSVALNQFSTLQVSGSLITTGSITSLGGITGSIAATNGVISGSSQLTTTFPSKTTGAWSVPAGASTQSFTVEQGHSYTMWVNGNIPNGIITWNATITTSNSNVPVVGSQYGWYYTPGNALVLTAMPDQIIGTTNTLISSPASYAPNTSNVFKFGITNNSGTTQTINYGYIKLS